ncbi:MAG: class II glutamine amidotransferase, partial [Pseudomonadales bacterium RIFCSPHIGHO2_02_FULL_60_43]
MCELLGMSANVPTDIVFSFTGLMQRGGRTGPHRDGWGIGFYEGRGLRLFQDPRASSESEVAQLVQRYPIKSEVVIGHIRQANVGRVCLANTHPFVREMWGRNWCFAHNGQLADFAPQLDNYRPIGDTDSEAAFCDLLNRLRQAFPEPVEVERLLPTLVSACAGYRQLGVFNCLLSDGDWLFSFCSSK